MDKLTSPAKWTLRIGVVVVLGAVILFYLGSKTNSDITQPIAYSHKAHIETAGLNCTDCHSTVQTSQAATLPSLEVCSTCHSEQPISQSPEELKLLEFVKRAETIPWQRVYRVPDHVYFSHRRHVAKGELECAACHGNVGDFTLPASSQFLPLTMENCMKCHRENNVTNDCLACHR